jgi:hypothetical protein
MVVSPSATVLTALGNKAKRGLRHRMRLMTLKAPGVSVAPYMSPNFLAALLEPGSAAGLEREQ